VKCIAFIPARLQSKRFPKKVIKELYGLPMIEHVRRRALLSGVFDEVYVVTNNIVIKNIVSSFGGKVLLNNKIHRSGTSRVSEVVRKLKFDKAFIIFSDEPFIKPNQIKFFYKEVLRNKEIKIWNAVTSLEKDDYNLSQVVKVLTRNNNLILDFFRKKNIKNKKVSIIYKSSGLFAFDKENIVKYLKLKIPKEERKTSIEQFRILKNNILLGFIKINNVYSSINTLTDLKKISKQIKHDKSQLFYIKKTQSTLLN
jgi:3-deoxy-manno-octulosonate cytidylyltransferase (CMP-KDO synthetase)